MKQQTTFIPQHLLRTWSALCLALMLSLPVFADGKVDEEQKLVPIEKHVIGPVAEIDETESKLKFKARVDTGATTTSLHAEDLTIKDESPDMEENLGKTIRFRIKNHEDKTEWLEREIKEITVVKTSVKAQHRYKVPVELRWKDFSKEVLVTLNDRSHMTYALLLGRNFLKGKFVVDVDLDKNAPKMQLVSVTTSSKADAPEEEASVKSAKKENQETTSR